MSALIFTITSANTYVSYTFLDDDVNATKCLGPNPAPSGVKNPGDQNGPPSTKYCADGGVYYLNKLPDNSNILPVAPNGFDSLLSFGIFPWFPTSGSARAYRALNPDASQTPVYDTPEAEAAYNAFVADFAANRTGQLLDLIGQTPGSWSLPVCDQGFNTWTFDWSNSGGLDVAGSDVSLPCACGHLGSGTANFYKTLKFSYQSMSTIASSCETLLLNVAAGMELTEGNIGWNAIAGGKPTSIVYDENWTITAPSSLPTRVCSISGKRPCPNLPPAVVKANQFCQAHPNECA